MINKDTKLFFSVSSNPGNFGATLYNRAFQEMGIDAIYKPLKIEGGFIVTLEGLQKIGAVGVSVSMPFKALAAHYSSCSIAVSRIGNANTIKFFEDKAYSYNTDCVGFERSCPELLETTNKAVIFGTGAVARSISYILEKKNISHRMVGSNLSLYPKEFENFLINATPVGMSHIQDDVFFEDVVEKYDNVFDVVVSKEPTELIKLSSKLGKKYVAGWEMSIEQLCEQFKIYTKQEPPRELFSNILKKEGYCVQV